MQQRDQTIKDSSPIGALRFSNRMFWNGGDDGPLRIDDAPTGHSFHGHFKDQYQGFGVPPAGKKLSRKQVLASIGEALSSS
jgi:hypothetical protein